MIRNFRSGYSNMEKTQKSFSWVPRTCSVLSYGQHSICYSVFKDRPSRTPPKQERYYAAPPGGRQAGNAPARLAFTSPAILGKALRQARLVDTPAPFDCQQKIGPFFWTGIVFSTTRLC
jgi:hypothetical protein